MSIKHHLKSLELKLSFVEKKIDKMPAWDQASVTKIKRERLVLRDHIKSLRKENVA